MKKLLILALIFLTISCKRDEDVAKFARIEKWDSYQITGVCYFGCGQDDFFKTKFKAFKNGESFEGCVCSSAFKNSTLRID